MGKEVEIKEIKELVKEVWLMWKETDKRFKETDKKFKETDEKIRRLSEDTDRKIKELSEEIKRVMGLFTSQWGRLVEALVEPGTLQLFKERGIKVNKTSKRVKLEDEEGNIIMEIDILLENEEVAVVTEVKTQVKVEDVKEFLEKLKKFKEYFPKYKEMKVYGAVAGIEFEEGADRYAYKQGLFVLKFKEGMIKIANDKKFKPKEW
jgi:hypothetical protein